MGRCRQRLQDGVRAHGQWIQGGMGEKPSDVVPAAGPDFPREGSSAELKEE
jgi:hypothetical protein